MTAYINKLKDKTGNQQLPVTHERAVRDDNGTTAETKFQNLEGAMDKAYVASSDNGMGRITLKKNMVSGVNTLTQSMMQATNTIYVIRYDFTLGEDITVPENCVLEFEGGSVSASGSNDIIIGNNTGIDAGLVKVFNTNVTLAGTWNVAEAYPEWFGAKGDGSTDDTTSIQKCINFINLRGGVVKFSAKTYRADELSIGGVVLEGVGKGNDGNRATIIQPIDTVDCVIKADGINSMGIGGGLRNLMISGNNSRQSKTNTYNCVGIYIHKWAEFDIENVFISGFSKQGLLSKDWWDAKVSGLEIRACGNVLNYPGLQLDCDTDSTNSIHFFTLHIEECPFEVYINKICSHIQFTNCKFETASSDTEQITESIAGGGSPVVINIYEGVYAVSFVNCFFRHNIPNGAIGVCVRNNYTVIDACQFVGGSTDGTLIKNTSANSSYGKTLIVSNCNFNSGNNVIVCDLNKLGIFNSNKVFGGKIKCFDSNKISNNYFEINSDHPTINISSSGDVNYFHDNTYVGSGYIFNNDRKDMNKLDSNRGFFVISDAKPLIDFNKNQNYNFINNGANSINFSSSDIIHPYADCEITIGSTNGTVSLDSSLVPGGIQISGGQYKTLKYLYPIQKWIEL